MCYFRRIRRDGRLAFAAVDEQPIIVRKPGQLLAARRALQAVVELRRAAVQDHLVLLHVILGMLGRASARAARRRLADSDLSVGIGGVQLRGALLDDEHAAQFRGSHLQAGPVQHHPSAVLRRPGLIAIGHLGSANRGENGRRLLLLAAALLHELAAHIPFRRQSPLVPIDLGPIRFDAVATLPKDHAAFIAYEPLRARRVHTSRRGMEGFALREHRRRLLRALGLARGNDVSFARDIPSVLVRQNSVRR